ncbi:TetR family transcriptional regulator [Saccharopolyspora erythraea NRRL 2338]|uniref:Transcriptional regulator (TetR family) n=2 Tax=Saccharopolyspora erythraea TaxID=1836 RepID=A4FDP4_SACEN|nr:TetR family transcriptional regulator [Saccharopolyspora erythraea D]PFG95904.1 TetR family transcriptional regulator [Saccharopolyspora erythraea NRRL 2338]CAM02169.1 transcriptional regulator (TetR family) [Saccharopolyspora erythraea NRRL 2338]
MARPRDERIDLATLKAVRSLLPEVGYQGLTLEAVAAHAGTTKPAIRRRWPSQKHLVVDAITEHVGSTPTPDTGCTHCDLVAGIDTLRRTMTGPLLTLTLPPLVADLRDDDVLRNRFFDRFFNPRRQTTARAIERGIERGDVREDVDVELLLDMLAATMTYRLLFGHQPIAPGLSEEIVDVVMRGVATPQWAKQH